MAPGAPTIAKPCGRTPVAPNMRDGSAARPGARGGGLRGSELSDPTITVTSLGDQGVEEVVGVIFPPQVAIVGFGRIVERPWIDTGRVMPMPVVRPTLSADHRVTDGHRAARFLAAVDDALQAPEDP